MTAELERSHKNKRLLKKLLIGVVFMFGFCYMLVPLYSMLCKQVGINGRSNLHPMQVPTGMQVDKSRSIKVQFSSIVHGPLQFVFKPLQHFVTVHPGETKLVYFYAQNNMAQGVTVQAIPSITPDQSAKYLHKTQCFCFTQQHFFHGEKADMPVYFYVSPSLPKNIHDMTLSYTLFDAGKFLKPKQKVISHRIPLNTPLNG